MNVAMNIILYLMLIYIFIQGKPGCIVFFSPSVVQFSQSVLMKSGCLQPSTLASFYRSAVFIYLTLPS